jgi:hypothetical protein
METQAKDGTAVNREIAVSATMKVITLNEIMETLTVIKVEVTVVTQEADPVTITAKGVETKTETETTTDKIDTRDNETHQIHTDNKSNVGQDTYISNQSKAMPMSQTMNFTLPTKSFMTQTRPMTRKKMTNC